MQGNLLLTKVLNSLQFFVILAETVVFILQYSAIYTANKMLETSRGILPQIFSLGSVSLGML